MLSNGSIFSWGNNNIAQLGLGSPLSSNIFINIPTLVPEINNVANFSFGNDYAFILLGIKI